MSSLRETWRQMHKPQFWLILLATIGWVALGVWLQMRIGWPDRYGFHCSGKSCLIIGLWHSPALIRGGHWGEYTLCAWLWSMPIGLVALFAWVKLRKRRLKPGDAPPDNF